MRRSRGGNRVRKTKELPVVEFALILWLLFIFILVVIQANHNLPVIYIDTKASGEDAHTDAIYPAHRSITCMLLMKLISTLQQVVPKSVNGSPPNVTGTVTTVPNPTFLEAYRWERAFLYG